MCNAVNMSALYFSVAGKRLLNSSQETCFNAFSRHTSNVDVLSWCVDYQDYYEGWRIITVGCWQNGK